MLVIHFRCTLSLLFYRALFCCGGAAVLCILSDSYLLQRKTQKLAL
jgi:hypothetical protein